MDDTKSSRTGWTEAEKLGIILQLVNKLPKIPWEEIELPPGRTRKACQVMLDKEKSKVKKAEQEGANKDNDNGKSPVMKRKAAVSSEDKKTKKPRAAAKKAKVESEDEQELEETVKSEED